MKRVFAVIVCAAIATPAVAQHQTWYYQPPAYPTLEQRLDRIQRGDVTPPVPTYQMPIRCDDMGGGRMACRQ